MRMQGMDGSGQTDSRHIYTVLISSSANEDTDVQTMAAKAAVLTLDGKTERLLMGRHLIEAPLDSSQNASLTLTEVKISAL